MEFYNKPEMEIILFTGSNVITTSGGWINPDGNLGDGEDSDKTEW